MTKRITVVLFCIAAMTSKGVSADTTASLRKFSPYFQHVLNGEQAPARTLHKKHSPQRMKTFIQADGDSSYPAIISTSDLQELQKAGVQINSVRNNFVTVHVTPSQLRRLSASTSIKFVREAKMRKPNNDIAAGLVGARSLQNGVFNNTDYTGEGVLVCDIGTGIDWKHPDFRDPADTTKSRIVALWDQTLTAGSSDKKVKGYGVLYTQTQMNNELDGSPAGFVRESDVDGHNTHVCGIIAGNGASMTNCKYAGMAPKAGILVVKTDFYSSDIIDAMDWADSIATALGKPLVINLSLGSVLSAHDGTEDDELAIDEISAKAGRVFTVSAGNSGEDYCHVSGTMAANDSATITFTVPSYSANSGTENDYVYIDAWMNDSSNVTGFIQSPNKKTVKTTEGSWNYNTSSDGFLELDNYVGTNNGKREISAYIIDYNGAPAPKSGTWTMRLYNRTSKSVPYHAWFESYLGTSESIVSVTNGNNNYVVSSPGNAASAITAAAYASRWFWPAADGIIHYWDASFNADNVTTFSGGGPRVDNVQKPDIAAPGLEIISAFPGNLSISENSSSVTPDKKHQVMAGTSMAAPCVAGSCALLLQQSPALTASEIKNLITSTADTDSYTGAALPHYKWGYGKLDVLKAMRMLVSPAASNARTILAYDQWPSYSGAYMTSTAKVAVRITPSSDGKITGVFFHTYSILNLSGPYKIEIWSDNGGLPGSLLNGPFAVDASSVIKGSWNYADLSADTISVTANTSYHVVLYNPASTTDTLSLMFDTGTINGRTSKCSVGTWSAYSSGNARIRAAVMSSGAGATSVSSCAANTVTKFEILQNYPNPFNPSTTISFTLERDGLTTLKVYDILGREVAALVNGEMKAGVVNAVIFNASKLSSGVYFSRLESCGKAQIKKLLLIK
jgi:subtilisin family serine protease